MCPKYVVPGLTCPPTHAHRPVDLGF